MAQNNQNIAKESEELFTTQDLLNEAEVSQKDSETVVESAEDQLETPETPETPIQDDEMESELTEEDKENVDEPTSENIGSEKSTTKSAKKPPADRLTELPLSKIKSIIKLDPEVQLVSNEAVFLITRATENFIKSLSKESAQLALQQKKKTVMKSHVDFALTMLPIEL